MSEIALFNNLVAGWLVLAAITVFFLFSVTAPYGRHARGGWGPTVDHRLGWIIMEAPAALVFAALFVLGETAHTPVSLVFLGMWEAHYVHRAFIYPLGLRAQGKRMPVAIAATALVFNTANGYLNGRYLFSLSDGYEAEWLGDLRFLAGLALFIVGYTINRQADHTLRNLRQPGERGYKIPHSGLYRWISCPNYLGEIATWIGWAIATWSPPGAAFALWTAANLVPRARAHHRWYREHFPDYPPERKALVPGLW
jgi:3-oxo-5-alpha-steroid 4-dehydrogenase 1